MWSQNIEERERGRERERRRKLQDSVDKKEDSFRDIGFISSICTDYVLYYILYDHVTNLIISQCYDAMKKSWP